MPIGKFPSDMHGMRHGHIDGIPYFRFWCQKTLPALYDDSLSYYDLLTNVVWYINQLITVAKAYDEKFAELEGLYIELEHYVATYFDKLNVEQTVADILNDMAYSGRLTEIMCTYINDYSIDAKKIKNGFVPVHYEFVKCDENNDYYKRDLTDKEMIDALRHGSILLGIFNGSPQFGNFIMFHDTAEYDYNGTTIQCKCGCSCEHLVQNYKVTYREAMANKNGKLVMYIVTDEYCKQYATGYYGQMYADVEDGAITTDKLADGAVTHPKLADDAVWENNIKDGAVTPRKLGKGNIVIIGDVYDLASGGWSSRLVSNLGIGSRSFIGHADGAGFVGNNNQTFLKVLQTVASGMSEGQRLNTSYIVVGGGNDDRGKGEGEVENAIKAFATYVRSNFPNAEVIVGEIGWQFIEVSGSKTWGYQILARRYAVGCGKAGFRFIANSPYVLHDYSLFDGTGWKPNAQGCEEIASMFGVELAGGQYTKIGERRQVGVTAASGLEVGPPAQNEMFPDDPPQTGTTTLWTWMENGAVSLAFTYFHTLKFTSPKNMICHAPAETGYTGKFDVLTINNTNQLYSQNAYNSPRKYLPCSVVDSSGTCYPCNICIMYEGNKISAFLYEGSDINHDSNAKLGFKMINNVKYIHWGADLGEITVKSFDS